MHDIVEFEARGIPAVIVASEGFRDAAESQAVSLGMPVARVFVSHPIQDRTDTELHAYADAALPAIIAAVVASES